MWPFLPKVIWDFSDKNIALQKKRSKSTRSFFSDIPNLCSRPVSIYEILFNVFSDLHKLESFNLNEIKNYNRYKGDGGTKQAVYCLFLIKYVIKSGFSSKKKKSFLMPKHTYIREMDFVARLIKDVNEDIINSASFQDPAFAWLNLKSWTYCRENVWGLAMPFQLCRTLCLTLVQYTGKKPTKVAGLHHKESAVWEAGHALHSEAWLGRRLRKNIAGVLLTNGNHTFSQQYVFQHDYMMWPSSYCC